MRERWRVWEREEGERRRLWMEEEEEEEEAGDEDVFGVEVKGEEGNEGGNEVKVEDEEEDN